MPYLRRGLILHGALPAIARGLVTIPFSMPPGVPLMLSIDPGIDDLGWALWRLPARPALGWPACKQLLVRSGTVHTKTEWRDEDRLGVIGSALKVELERRPDTQLARVYIEIPATDGAYAERAARTRGRGFSAGAMKHVHRLAGVFTWFALERGAHAEFIKARSGRGSAKKDQHRSLAGAWGELGRTSEDERDALCLGCRVLTSPLLNLVAAQTRGRL